MFKNFSFHNKRKTFTYSLLFGIILSSSSSFSAFSQETDLRLNRHLSERSDSEIPLFLENRLEKATVNSPKESSSELKEHEKSQSPFDAVKGKKEDCSKRDLFSKHYINEDGSFTALIGAGPIHYEKNGRFYDIDHTIIPSNDANFPYVNATNLFSSYFGATAHTGVKNKTAEGEIQELLNTKMYWEVNGQIVNEVQSSDVPVSIEGDKAYYHHLFGNIAAELIVLTGKRKLNYIIPSAQDLGNVPENAEYLVFTEDVVLPFGWTSSLTETGIMIKDAMGQEIYLYENPHSTDAESHALREENTIFETLQIGNTLTIKTKVKTDWLNDSERVFPVKVDPTVSVDPDNLANWTRSVNASGSDYNSSYFGFQNGVQFRSFIKFNTSSIASSATVNSATGHFNIHNFIGAYTHYDNGFRFNNSGDPTTIAGSALYNSASTVYSNDALTNESFGWKSATINATGRTDVQNNLGGSTSMSVSAARTYHIAYGYTTIYEYEGRTSGNRPYLSINYTIPSGSPSCATVISPQNGINDAAHSGSLTWEPVSGAESYDVYFGTSPTPPLVSTSQTGTSYNVGSCLPPETTYYWKIVPKNSYGEATGCSTWSFTTDNKLHIYKNDWETATEGYFGTSGVSVDGWYTNNNSGIYIGGNLYSNQWTVGSGPNAINGKSAGISGTRNGGLGGDHFDYWTDLGEIYRWIYRPFNMTGLRDIELEFNWKGGGENGQDYGNIASSINGGANWLTDNQGGLYSDGEYWNSPNTVQSQALTFPSTRNNQSNFQLAFKWNDLSGNGFGGQNSFIVDDIVIKACPFEGTLSSPDETSPYTWIPPTSNTTTTITVNGSHSCAYYEWEKSTDGGITWDIIQNENSVSYTTPSGLTETTLYRSRVYFGTGCSGVYQKEPFEIILQDPLPITLSSFTASCNNEKTILHWSTASEMNSAYFIVEKSRDGIEWTFVKQVLAAGNSSTTINYSVEDLGNNKGITYYRLVQVDYDGKQEVFGPISNSCGEKLNDLVVYPNPNNGDFTVEINSAEGIKNATLQLVDITGKTILSRDLQITSGTTQVFIEEGNRLSTGAYVLRLLNNDHYFKPVKIIVK